MLSFASQLTAHDPEHSDSDASLETRDWRAPVLSFAAMSGEAEAAGDALTGAIVARAVEGQAGEARAHGEAPAACRNCGASLTGAYCANCGQSAHIHRSLLALAHDILHGAFHFEGKFWRTIPELLFHPGRLTRRYIDGERAKFVSPMALFLFTVFLMFAVFSFTSQKALDAATETAGGVTTQWKEGNAAAMEKTNEEIETLQERLEEDAGLTGEQRARIQEQIAELQAARGVMEALSRGDFAAVAEIDQQNDERKEKASSNRGMKVDLGAPALDARLNRALREAQSNPQLLLYKLKVNSYKFSWALIPLSVPFVWILFFWRRDVHLYDHAIFVTYSISFMMLLVILCALASFVGVPAGIWGSALAFVPPVHMYKHLRYTYGISRFGAYMRLMLLLTATVVVLTIFLTTLVLIGVLG